MINKLKSLVKKSFNSFGFEIKKLNANNKYPQSFITQKELFTGRDNLIIFDVGAYIGQTVGIYSELFENSRIYCFEPFPDSYLQIRSNYSSDNIDIQNLAISDKNEKSKLYVNKMKFTNSLNPVDVRSNSYIDHEITEFEEIINVESITIDSFCEKNTIKKIDILKLDIQGAELNALMGARNMLDENKIDCIYTEILFSPLYENQTDFFGINEYLMERGFNLFGIYNLTHGKNGLLAWGDAIYINKNY